MPWETIRKSDAEKADAALPDPEKARRDFTWNKARQSLAGPPEGGLNIAHEALDRHVDAGRGDWLAIRWLGEDGSTRDLTYRDLLHDASGFASILARHGAVRGTASFP